MSIFYTIRGEGSARRQCVRSISIQRVGSEFLEVNQTGERPATDVVRLPLKAAATRPYMEPALVCRRGAPALASWDTAVGAGASGRCIHRR
jgi:hypothetical protein